MTPPIRVDVRTDNRSKCELRISGADGDPQVIEVPNDGNVYSGLHAARHQLERTINDILAAHGIVPEPASTPAPPSVQPDAPKPTPKKTAAAKKTPTTS